MYVCISVSICIYVYWFDCVLRRGNYVKLGSEALFVVCLLCLWNIQHEVLYFDRSFFFDRRPCLLFALMLGCLRAQACLDSVPLLVSPVTDSAAPAGASSCVGCEAGKYLPTAGVFVFLYTRLLLPASTASVLAVLVVGLVHMYVSISLSIYLSV